MVTVASGSAVELSTAVTLAEAVRAPAGIVTVAGTVAREVAEEVSVTVRAEAVEPERVMVAEAAGALAFSATVSGVTSTVRSGAS